MVLGDVWLEKNVIVCPDPHIPFTNLIGEILHTVPTRGGIHYSALDEKHIISK